MEDICRELSINKATFYNWKKKYGGMEASHLKRFKELEEENRKLKAMYADLSLDHRILKDIIEKKKALSEERSCTPGLQRDRNKHPKDVPNGKTDKIQVVLQ